MKLHLIVGVGGLILTTGCDGAGRYEAVSGGDTMLLQTDTKTGSIRTCIPDSAEDGMILYRCSDWHEAADS